MKTTTGALVASLLGAGLLAGCANGYSDMENAYWHRAVSKGAWVGEDSAVAVGHQACSMLSAGTARNAVVFTVWNEGGAGAKQDEASAMVDAAHEVLCPGA